MHQDYRYFDNTLRARVQRHWRKAQHSNAWGFILGAAVIVLTLLIHAMEG